MKVPPNNSAGREGEGSKTCRYQTSAHSSEDHLEPDSDGESKHLMRYGLALQYVLGEIMKLSSRLRGRHEEALTDEAVGGSACSDLRPTRCAPSE
jgi:hypothetical protein